MKFRRPLAAILFTLLFTVCSFGAVSADGIIIPEPPICDPWPCPDPFPIEQLAIVYHRVTVAIEDQVAVTHVDQVFRNDQNWAIEGTYVFPLPEDAAVSAFTLWIDNEPVEAKILDREEARQIYEEIVRQLRDPALLEYVDRGAVQASVFPIEPGEERRIELEYSQALTAEQGLIHYSYPLNTEKFSALPLEEVSISVNVTSGQPVRAVYSPTHSIAVDRQGDQAFRVGYEAYDVTPDKDFDLYYSVSMEDIGVNLLTYRDPYQDDEDGFFLLMAAPGFEIDPEQRLPQDVFFVLDQSGSMEGDKFLQAQQAAEYVLEHLDSEDRFNILSFSTGVRSYSHKLESTNHIEDALHWLHTLAPMGSTDINLALLEAVSQVDPDRPTLIIFLTDGLPTEGVVEAPEILNNLSREAPENVRLFAFGVGYDVDTFLLDSLANNHHGDTTYVSPGQPLDEVVSGFYAKVSTPVLTNLTFETGDIQLYDLHPAPIPDLFAGSQILLTGRYRGSGITTLTLNGNLLQEQRSFTYSGVSFHRSGGSDFIPRLWATRKIGTLLNQVRLNGPEQEVIDQIIAISIRYGIITPYTSFLVTEPEFLGHEAQNTLSEEFYADEMAAAPSVSGEFAVERAEAENSIRSAEVPLEVEGSDADIVQIAGTRTFRLVDGTWIDTQVDPEKVNAIRIPFLSDAYFELSASSSEAAASLALGEKVILRIGERTYEIVGVDEAGDSFELPATSGQESESDTENNEAAGKSDGLVFCPGFLLFGAVFLPIGLKAGSWR
ncbi:MAG: VWA domain-containing protein [Anaerolineales bacterium]|nr:VWA domain-containing protein [Anaerolineales bacterium]